MQWLLERKRAVVCQDGKAAKWSGQENCVFKDRENSAYLKAAQELADSEGNRWQDGEVATAWTLDGIEPPGFKS